MERVADRFALGPVVTAPVRVPGGLSNDLWRIRTENGTFAVKRMVVNADRSEFVDNVEAAFRVEARAFAAGVPICWDASMRRVVLGGHPGASAG
jgi:hypothetical protein